MADVLDKEVTLDDSASHEEVVGESEAGRDGVAEHHASNKPDKVAHLEEGTAEQVHVTSRGLEGASHHRKDSILCDDSSDTHTVGSLHQDEAPFAAVSVMAIVSAPVRMTAAEALLLPPGFPGSCLVSLGTRRLYSAMEFQCRA